VIRDIWTVVWKEWREFRDQLLSLRRGGLSALILALILGVVAPVQLGPEWVQSKIIVAYWPFLAATMVSSLIADSVAGERERHTLETLLASRLSDSAIVIGKIIAAVLYGVGFAVANLVLGLIAVNIAHRESAPILFGAQRLTATIVLTLLASLLMAGIGVFISLRASTVKQAQQAFGIAIIVLTMGPLLAFNALAPDTRFLLATRVGALGETKIEVYAVAILATLSVIVITGALARFRRGKLALD
jgi:ABC-2 type transport system permease protein